MYEFSRSAKLSLHEWSSKKFHFNHHIAEKCFSMVNIQFLYVGIQ